MSNTSSMLSSWSSRYTALGLRCSLVEEVVDEDAVLRKCTPNLFTRARLLSVGRSRKEKLGATGASLVGLLGSGRVVLVVLVVVVVLMVFEEPSFAAIIFLPSKMEGRLRMSSCFGLLVGEGDLAGVLFLATSFVGDEESFLVMEVEESLLVIEDADSLLEMEDDDSFLVMSLRDDEDSFLVTSLMEDEDPLLVRSLKDVAESFLVTSFTGDVVREGVVAESVLGTSFTGDVVREVPARCCTVLLRSLSRKDVAALVLVLDVVVVFFVSGKSSLRTESLRTESVVSVVFFDVVVFVSLGNESCRLGVTLARDGVVCFGSGFLL